MVFERGTFHFTRMHSTIKYFLGFMFWVPRDPELARGQVKRMSNKVTNDKELIDQCEEVFKAYIPPENF
jgi:hypothetical protein